MLGTDGTGVCLFISGPETCPLTEALQDVPVPRATIWYAEDVSTSAVEHQHHPPWLADVGAIGSSGAGWTPVQQPVLSHVGHCQPATSHREASDQQLQKPGAPSARERCEGMQCGEGRERGP